MISIQLGNDLWHEERFKEYRLEIEKKYRKQRISLTGNGLQKLVKRRVWKKMSQADIVESIAELMKISDEYNLKYIKQYNEPEDLPPTDSESKY